MQDVSIMLDVHLQIHLKHNKITNLEFLPAMSERKEDIDKNIIGLSRGSNQSMSSSLSNFMVLWVKMD